MSKHTHAQQSKREVKWTAEYRREWNRRYTRAYRRKHPRTTAAYNREYRKRNGARFKALRRRHYLLHRSEQLAAAKKWARQHRKRTKRNNRRYFLQHRRQLNAKRRDRNRRHRTIVLKQKRSWYRRNRVKVLASLKAARAKLPSRQKRLLNQRRRLWAKHRMRPEQYKHLKKTQKLRCAVCLRLPKRGPLEVDHDHRTGRVRGLLCGPCNRFLYFVETYPQRIPALRKYLKQFGR